MGYCFVILEIRGTLRDHGIKPAWPAGFVKPGDPCTSCGEGRFHFVPRTGGEERQTGESQEYRELECHKCGGRHANIRLGETVRVTASVRLKEQEAEDSSTA